MVFGFGRNAASAAHRTIDPPALDTLMQGDAAIIIDVREPHEFAAGHIAGAVNMPLSTFDPAHLPEPGDRTLVLMCLAGGRSGKALDRCAAAQAAVQTHLAGGLSAWVAAGLPVVR